VSLSIVSPSTNIAKQPAEHAKQTVLQNTCASTASVPQQSYQPTPSTGDDTFQQSFHYQSASCTNPWQHPPIHCLQQQPPRLYQPAHYPPYHSHYNQPSYPSHQPPHPPSTSSDLYNRIVATQSLVSYCVTVVLAVV